MEEVKAFGSVWEAALSSYTTAWPAAGSNQAKVPCDELPYQTRQFRCFTRTGAACCAEPGVPYNPGRVSGARPPYPFRGWPLPTRFLGQWSHVEYI